jgi:hypothetical protein
LSIDPRRVPDNGAAHGSGGRLSRRTVAAIVLVVVVLAAAVAGLVTRRSTGHRGSPGSPGGTDVPRIAPLTGLVEPSAAVGRCAVTVKVGNTQEAHPLSGVERADVVYEEVVDGGITRLAAVYQSAAPGQVGPVRSVRPTDQSIVWPLRGVFAFSGGDPIEVASIQGAPVTQLDETRAGPLMFRDPSRQAPHNLYADVAHMYGRCADPPPRPLFAYRRPHAVPAGTPASSVRVGFAPGYEVTWTWDAGSASWQRSIFGGPEVSATGQRIAAANVVVLAVSYVGGASSPDAAGVLTGQGRLTVFTAGKVVEGTWVRPDKSRAARLLDSRGRPVTLTPGRTWVELPDVGYAVTTTP